ncbi:MAG: alkaline phosphatase family protein [Anaerolineae bacterium]
MQDVSTSSPSPVIVFGLDGATWDIARPLLDAGRMPNLARLVAQGASGPLASTVPPISAAAWITFMTGQNPGRHGVYQFRKMDMRQYGGYRDEFATSQDYVGRSFIELAGQRGRRVAAVGVPMTYPPFPVNGFLVSGFPRPFGPQAQVYPPAKAEALGRWDEVQDSFNFSLSAAKTVETSDYWVRRYTDISLAALAEERFDLFLVVWNSTDNIPHLFWKYTDPAFPAYDATGAAQFGEVINHQYEVADAEIGRLLAALPDLDQATVLVMSDHGMGPHPHRCVNFGAWLAGQGLLTLRQGAASQPSLLGRTVRQVRRRLPRQWMDRLRDRLPAGLRADLYARQMNLDQIDWAGTAAYRLKVFPSVEGIVLNVAGRQPQGIVQPGAPYEAVRDRLLAAAAALVDPQTGRPIVARASRREELFEGPYVEDIPDILLELHPDYTGGSALQGELVTPLPLEELSAYSGSHSPTGLFVLHGPGVRRGHWQEGAHIQDLAPTLMHIMGLPVASWMDGQVLQELFEPSAVRPAAYAEYDVAERDPHSAGLSAADEEAIRAQLAGLGYLRD